MDNKEIQRQRMMTYFIRAAKEIIKEEGVKSLSVRKVGQRAGYSYATIYNYFNDLNTLLLYCVLDFLEDCYNHVINIKRDHDDCRNQIIACGTEYFKFFVQNPEMFQLIFLKNLELQPKDVEGVTSVPSIGLLLHSLIMECGKKGYISEDNIEIIGELITTSIHGRLLFFIQGRDTENLEDVIAAIEKELGFLLKVEG